MTLEELVEEATDNAGKDYVKIARGKLRFPKKMKAKTEYPYMKVATAGLYKSIKYEVVGGKLVITMKDNWQNVEDGRKATPQYLVRKPLQKFKNGKVKKTQQKSKLVEALKKWVKTRRLDPSLVWGARYKILKKGIKPYPFVAETDAEVFPLLEAYIEKLLKNI